MNYSRDWEKPGFSNNTIFIGWVEREQNPTKMLIFAQPNLGILLSFWLILFPLLIVRHQIYFKMV
jgi:fumarate reductase subunit D